MTGFEIIAGVIGAFFVIGIAVGAITVVALSALRYRRIESGDDWHAGKRERLDRRRDDEVGWQQPPGPVGHGDVSGDEGGEGPPRWPLA